MSLSPEQMRWLRDLRATLTQFSDRRFASVISTSLTRSARDVQALWGQRIQQRLDRPTPATLRAVVVQQATAENLVATVRVRDQGQGTPPAQWLAPNEVGGLRGMKKFEQALVAQGSMPANMRAVPGPGAELDQFGNVRRRQLIDVITQLGRDYSPGYQRVIAKSVQKRLERARKTGRIYRAVREQVRGVEAGIYRRTAEGREVLVFQFVRSTRYRPRLGLMDGALDFARGTFPRQVERTVAEHIERLQRQARPAA